MSSLLAPSTTLQAFRQTLPRSTARLSGLIIMTGPTGRSKTSTLSGVPAELKRRSASIITVENQVEYRIPDISQVDGSEKDGRMRGAALCSILSVLWRHVRSCLPRASSHLRKLSNRADKASRRPGATNDRKDKGAHRMGMA